MTIRAVRQSLLSPGVKSNPEVTEEVILGLGLARGPGDRLTRGNPV